jgi:excisionase family DNA binding protein
MVDMSVSESNIRAVHRKLGPGSPPAPRRQTFTVDEAAAILGISRSTAYECVRDGSLPALRFRHRIVVTQVALEALLNKDLSTDTR